MPSIMQPWTHEIGLRHQGVLVSAMRGCDIAPRHDSSKIIQRLLRGAVLIPHVGKYGNPKTYMMAEADPSKWWDIVNPFLRSWDHYPNHYVIHFTTTKITDRSFPQMLGSTTFYPDERIALFIDGANLYSSAKGLNFDLDYRKVLTFFRERGKLIRAFYFTAILEDAEYRPIQRLVDWLDYNGFTMVTKPAKEYTDNITGRRRIKGNMDIELAIDMLEMSDHIDHAVLFSGDGDFRRLVEVMQKRGVRVTVISTTKTSPPMASDDLRRQADTFIDLEELRLAFSRIWSKEDDREEDPEC